MAQQINKEEQEKGKAPYLLGKINKEGLTSSNYSWFQKNYDSYEPNKEIVDQLAKKINSFEIKIFLGTWCGDSKREVPKFYSILEDCKFPIDQLTMIAVSNKASVYKQSPENEEMGLNIHRVPTFIFYKNGIEINRIVESPQRSLEKDILEIISTNQYHPKYQVVSKLYELQQQYTFSRFKKEVLKNVPKFQIDSRNIYELLTYARVLKAQKNTKIAIEVLKLNTFLFPENHKSFQYLGDFYFDLDQKRKASKYYTIQAELTSKISGGRN